MVYLKTHLHESSLYSLTERLWFNNSSVGSNYQLWRTHVRHHFQRQDLLGFIDGTNAPPPETVVSRYNTKIVRNPDYIIWRRIDESLKQGILSLLEDNVIDQIEVHIESSTSRDIWLYLEKKFHKHLEIPPTAKVSDNAIITYVEQGKLLRASDENSELYSAALLGNKTAIQRYISTIKANEMNSKHAMALHVAVGAGEKAIDLVKKLGYLMSNDLIAAKDAGGNTALSIAAAVGNKAAATILVVSNSNLLYLPNISGDFPIHVAAKNAKRDTLIYLISVTKDDHKDQNPYEGYHGLALLTSTIEAGFYDIALYLVKKYPYLARLRLSSNSALKSIVEQKYRDDHVPTPNLFRFPNIDYYSSALRHPKDIDNSNIESLYISQQGSTSLAESMKKLYKAYFEPFKEIMMIRKLLVIDIVKFLCKEMKGLNPIEVEDICGDALLRSAKLGNHEIIEEILKAFPSVIHSSCPSFVESLIHVAVENRCIEVFNIVYRMSNYTHLYLNRLDSKGNNLLHRVATLAPPHKLSALSNATLRMQSEMQWYKEVEKLIHPRCKEQLNSTGKSPRMIFENEHKKLRVEGEKWVKDTSHMCTITAALISTIMFAASITAPGGTNSNTGLPFFAKKHQFVVFAVSDAISLFTSASSLLIFLLLSTFRYKEDDFLYSIPELLVFGMMCLVVSITTMMISFGATLNVVFGGKKLASLYTMVSIGLIIVAIFGFLLRSLLRDFAKLLNMNQGFLGERREPGLLVVSSDNKSVFERKVASHESV